MPLIKSFEAKLHGVVPMSENSKNRINLTVRFTKNMIWLQTIETERLFSAPFMVNPIAHKATYIFEKVYNRNDEKVYRVVISGTPSHTFVLDMNWLNKFKANCLHERYWLFNDSKTWIKQTIITAIIAMATYYFSEKWGFNKGYEKGLIEGKSKHQEANPQEKLKDSTKKTGVYSTYKH